MRFDYLPRKILKLTNKFLSWFLDYWVSLIDDHSIFFSLETISEISFGNVCSSIIFLTWRKIFQSNFIFNGFFHSWDIFIVNSCIFIWKKVGENIHRYSAESRNMDINSFIHETKIPVYYFHKFSDWINIGSFEVLNISLIKKRVKNFKLNLL